MTIKYDLVQVALEYYQNCGYKYLEVPWIVSPAALNITCPQAVPEILEPTIVASGEQSFIELIMQGLLSPGKYCCATPCYRPHDENKSEWHRSRFFKVELIEFSGGNLGEMINNAYLLFRSLGIKNLASFAVEDEPRRNCTTHQQRDLQACVNEQWIELGSYGTRSSPAVGEWIYGTGLAVPRFNQVLEYKKT